MTYNTAFAAGFLILVPAGVFAQDCTAEGDPLEFEPAQVAEIYSCIEARMAEGYAAEGDAVAADYRSWKLTSTRPAAPGPHGERFLQTFANDIAAEQYVKYADDGFTMPEGAVLAKESFTIKNGKAEPGPLFIMTKVASGEAPDADDWRYDALMPNGKVMKIQQSFCAGCHMNWEDSDSLAYPAEEVRLDTQ